MILPKTYTPPVESLRFAPQPKMRIAGLILALALALRVWGIWFGQPYVLHPDEHFLAQTALDMLRGPAYDLNPHFFEYPSLQIYVTAWLYACIGGALQLCGEIENFSQLSDYAAQHLFYFHLAGRLLAALIGAATVYLTFRAAQRLLGTATALLAAWFLTFAYVHFTDSHFLATDVPSAFWVMLAFNLCTIALPTHQSRWFYGAGFVAGLAASTKYPAGLILLTVFMAHAIAQRNAGASWRHTLFSSVLIKISLCALTGFVLGTPYAVLDFKSFASGLLAQIFHSKSGHLGVAESGFFGYFTGVVPGGGMGLGLMIAVFAGMLFSFLPPRRHHWLLFSFPLFFYLLMGNSALKVDRYLIPAIPFWCIYAGFFVARLSAMLSHRGWPKRTAAVALAFIFSASSLYAAGKWCWIAVQSDTRVQAANWMEASIPEETIIAIRAGSWMLPPVDPDHFNITQMDLITEESDKKKLSMKLAVLENPVSAWVLRQGFNYQAEPALLDSLRAILQNMPDFSTWRAQPLRTYREQNVHYVITSSLLKKRFFNTATMEKYPAMAKSWQEFYGELEKEGRLVKEFVPPAAYKHKWGMGFLESPAIRIYDIRAQE